MVVAELSFKERATSYKARPATLRSVPKTTSQVQFADVVLEAMKTQPEPEPQVEPIPEAVPDRGRGPRKGGRWCCGAPM